VLGQNLYPTWGPSFLLREAYWLFNTLPSGDLELQRLAGQCGIDLDTARLVLWPDIDEIVSLAHDVETKCAAISDNITRARSLVLLGTVLQEAQQPQEALHYLDQARVMLKAAGNTYNLATAYQITSWVHYFQGRLSEALDAIEEAWKHAQLTENMSIQAVIPSLWQVPVQRQWRHRSMGVSRNITNEGLIYWESVARRTCVGVHGLRVPPQR